VEGIFIEIGNIPATGFLNSLVDFNEKDEIIVDPKTCQTKTPGLYAAGDVTDVKYKQIVVACGEGTKALLSVAEYLRNKNNAD
jgi:alkyl hydroperoxide reductase subunit AhpF